MDDDYLSKMFREMDIKQEQVIPDGALMMVMHSCEMAEGNAIAHGGPMYCP